MSAMLTHCEMKADKIMLQTEDPHGSHLLCDSAAHAFLPCTCELS